MKKFREFIRAHFVEVVGFTGIFFLILIISYLKVFHKTFICEQRITEGNSKIYQKYTIKQTNNKLKSINYYYSVTTPDSKTKKQVTEFYNNLITNSDATMFNSGVKLKYNGDKMILSYDIDLNEVKDNAAYKSASSFVKSAKASGFTCK